MRKEQMRRPLRTKALQRFLKTEAGSASFLLIAAVVALAWANSPLASSYETIWSATLRSADAGLPTDARHWINEGLMAAFFFVVGLEIKRELLQGELMDIKQAALPVAGAVGGMVVPALVYLLVNPSGEASAGWPVPMATDIAFAVGMVALLGRYVLLSVKLFILALAIADDIGAVVVIAFLRPDHLDAMGMGMAGAGLAAAFLARRYWASRGWTVVAVGLVFWALVFRSGLHPTLAGVILATLVPSDDEPGENGPIERFQEAVHPWTSLVVLPLFALANAGVKVEGIGAVGSKVAVGIALGLVAGKTLGISAGVAVAVRLRVASVPEGVTPMQLVGAAALCGIGFTVSLFMAGLVFEGPTLDQAKVGILLGSVLSALLGAGILRYWGLASRDPAFPSGHRQAQ